MPRSSHPTIANLPTCRPHCILYEDVIPPPCECDTCTRMFLSTRRQKEFKPPICHGVSTDMSGEAQRYVRHPSSRDHIDRTGCLCTRAKLDKILPEVKESILEIHVQSLCEEASSAFEELASYIEALGNVILRFWKKSNRATRQKLIDKALPNLNNDRFPFTNWMITNNTTTSSFQVADFEEMMVVPWLNKKILVEEPNLLLALLFGRSSHAPLKWVAHDLEQTDNAWHHNMFILRWSERCIDVTSEGFGEIRD